MSISYAVKIHLTKYSFYDGIVKIAALLDIKNKMVRVCFCDTVHLHKCINSTSLYAVCPNQNGDSLPRDMNQ